MAKWWSVSSTFLPTAMPSVPRRRVKEVFFCFVFLTYRNAVSAEAGAEVEGTILGSSNNLAKA
jgi:hypothetical protein